MEPYSGVRRCFYWAIVLFLSAIFVACAQLNSIYRSRTITGNKPHVISIDSKQRVILSNPREPISDLYLESLNVAKKELDSTRTISAKIDSMAAALSPVGPCSDKPIDEANPPSGVLVNQAKAKNAKCAEATEAANRLKEAEDYYKLIKNAVAKEGGEARNPYIVRFCAEPPPDVFSALASSLGSEVSVSQTASTDVAARIATTISENAATIERTQTVNILREAMYRNCERYLSGAIGEDEFIIQASRDQQLIVQVLAVEQITGVAKAQSTALTTVARAAAGGVSDISLTTISDAKKDLDSKRANSTKAAVEAEALPPSGACSEKPLDEKNPPTGVSAEQVKAKNVKCAEVAETAKRVKEAEEYYTLIKETVSKQGSVNSEAQGQLASAALTATESSKEIAEKVVDIVRQYQAFDEIGMSCVVKLRTMNEPPAFCRDLLQQMADTRTAQLEVEHYKASVQTARLKIEEEYLNAERTKAYQSDMNLATNSFAEIVWAKLNNKIDQTNLKSLANKAGVSIPNAHMKRLENAGTDFEKFLMAFKRMPFEKQKQLAIASTQP